MRVLALDTTTREGSVALIEDERTVDERSGDAGRTHAERLPGEIVALLDAHGWRLTDVDLFAVAAGPGSFTGLRIGIATMQGLALVHEGRLVGVSALDALAQLGSADVAPGARVAAWMDARRREVFAALYEVTDAPLFSLDRVSRIEGPLVGDPDATLARWTEKPIVFIGDGAALYAEAIARATLDARVVAAPRLAGAIGRVAIARARNGAPVDPALIQPLYVRRPDAETAKNEAVWHIEQLTSFDQIDAVLEIEKASFTSPWTREMYLSELANQGVSYCFLAKEPGGRVVGFCSFWRVLDELHINNLAVLPDLRRRGVASALLSHVVAQGAALGAARATLEVRRSNEAARLLYGRFGFTIAGVRRAYYTNPVEDALVLWRDRLPRD
ncbi:MAG TPA: tRNA (adenosine(37)-N6)-threonylcarbamoyltransferase complex dimerization subunit type 1 TsaB [Vicinamibacterales bacterium]|jgi:tRNA threonylcarbamoyl adenosine modification protein YeaZ/ribosomal-protein-alanine acetyltransferase|nr:tRNA (adenosine(37)-N6)-threonylcarbamoyltransferase complex dimerization subunit type 1 TsaB [Vicinamibacterales bacterium]